MIRQEKWDERKKKEIDTFTERQIIIQRKVGKETDKERGEEEREREEEEEEEEGSEWLQSKNNDLLKSQE